MSNEMHHDDVEESVGMSSTNVKTLRNGLSKSNAEDQMTLGSNDVTRIGRECTRNRSQNVENTCLMKKFSMKNEASRRNQLKQNLRLLQEVKLIFPL
jgi:hypothetical protein